MTPQAAVVGLLEAFEAASLDYVIVGALAAGAWGIPRSTKDADFVVACPAQKLDEILRKLPESFSIDPQSRIELFTGTLRWILHIAGTSFDIEAFLLGSDSHHTEIFARKQSQQILMLDRESVDSHCRGLGHSKAPLGPAQGSRRRTEYPGGARNRHRLPTHREMVLPARDLGSPD